MKKLKFYMISSGLFSIVAGALLAILRGGVLSAVITIVGIGFIVSDIGFSGRITKFSLLRIIIGVCTVVFGNTFINFSMYVLGIALIVLGIFRFTANGATGSKLRGFRYAFIMSFRPVSTVLAGVFILFNPFGSVDLLFTVCGILMIICGIWDLRSGITFKVN